MRATRHVARALTALVVGATGLALAGCSLLGGSSGPAATSTASAGADVFTIKVGDCLDDAALEGQVSKVPTVDCAQPHDSEAYSSITMDGKSFPGADAVKSQSESGCTAAFNTFVGIDYNASKLAYSYYYPTAESWAQGDREILCIISDPAGKTTGSLKGAAR